MDDIKIAYYILIEKSHSKWPAGILDGRILLIRILKKQNVGCVLRSGDSGTYRVAGTLETENKIVGSTRNEECPYQFDVQLTVHRDKLCGGVATCCHTTA